MFYYYYLSFTIIIVFTEKATKIKDETHVTILEKIFAFEAMVSLPWPISVAPTVAELANIKLKTGGTPADDEEKDN